MLENIITFEVIFRNDIITFLIILICVHVCAYGYVSFK